MKNLLIDIGNTNVKAGVQGTSSGAVKLLKRFSYSKNNFQNDFESNFYGLLSKNNYSKIGLSASAGSNRIFLDDYFKFNFRITPVFINRNLKLPLKIQYSRGLGSDRICSAAAAINMFKNRNILIVDFGTATTYTFINNKKLTGGMISPGIGTSFQSMLENTSLPKVNLKFPASPISNNTSDNIRGGLLYQSLFTLERYVTDVRKKYSDLLVIATGGYSKIISSKTKLIDKLVPNLVLSGINFILSDQNENSY